MLFVRELKMKVKDIATLYHCAEDHVCDVIHAFNETGLDCLKPNYRGGRPISEYAGYTIFPAGKEKAHLLSSG